MTDSDSGAHVTDVGEITSQEGDSDLRREEKYRPISETMATLPPIRSISQDSIPSSESLKGSTISPVASLRKNSRIAHESMEHFRQGVGIQPSDEIQLSSNSASSMTSAYVHITPKPRKNLNGVTHRRNTPLTRQSSFPSFNSSRYIKSCRTRRQPSFKTRTRARSFDSTDSSNRRTAYDFAPNHHVSPRKNSQRQLELNQVELAERQVTDEDEFDNTPWMPTGLFAALVITSWAAILKLVDGIEGNGPAVCSSSEEVRLWICAGALTVFHGLAEAIFKRKELFKVLFSMMCVLAYMVITHTQPISCRLGEAKITEVSIWQSAICFFVSAVLAAVVYHDVKIKYVRRRKVRSPRIKGRLNTEENQEYESDEFDNFELPPPPPPPLVPSTV